MHPHKPISCEYGLSILVRAGYPEKEWNSYQPLPG